MGEIGPKVPRELSIDSPINKSPKSEISTRSEVGRTDSVAESIKPPGSRRPSIVVATISKPPTTASEGPKLIPRPPATPRPVPPLSESSSSSSPRESPSPTSFTPRPPPISDLPDQKMAKRKEFGEPEEEVGDSLRGKGITRTVVPYADSQGRSLPAGVVSLNAQFHKDATRSFYQIDEKTVIDPSITSPAVRENRLYSFCKSLIETYGPTGFMNITLIANQTQQTELYDHLCKSHRLEETQLFAATKTVYDVKEKLGEVTITIQTDFVIKDTSNGHSIGNRGILRKLR